MAQNVVLRAKGLHTHSNPLSSTPEGSLSEAINVVIDRNEIIEQRRGFAQYGNSFGDGTDRSKQLFNYKDKILRHVLNQIQFDSGEGNFLPFSGNAVNEIEPGVRVKGVEANGNFYFVTINGIKKLSAKTSTDFPNISIQDSGGVKALDITSKPNYTSTGFLTGNSKTAYSVVWGIKDSNENLILGSPSSRSVVYNLAAGSCVVDLSFAVPGDVTSTNYFYQIYRTGVFAGTPGNEAPDPGEEMNLVFEEAVTSAQITSKVVTVKDITPDEFRKNGTLRYTNPVSGEGVEQSNEKPPFCKDIAVYKNYTFYANTRTVQRLNVSFLSVKGLTSNVSTITVADGVQSNIYTFQGSVEKYTITYTGCVAADFLNAAAGPAKHFTITSSNDEKTYYVWYYETANDQDPLVPGAIGIKTTIIGTDTIDQVIDKTVTAMKAGTTDFNIVKSGTTIVANCANNGKVTIAPTETVVKADFTIAKDGLGTGEDSANKKIFLPRVPTGSENGPTTSIQLEQVARSLIKVINEQDTIAYAYYFSGFDDIPGQILLERRSTTGIAFFLNSNAGTQFTPTLPATGNAILSNNEIRPNRMYYSKLQQPEAVPLANYVDIGPQDREIKRIIGLRDSLFIFKEDGIYRLSGESAPFSVAPFDYSAQVLAPDTAVVLNNQIYALSTQGVIVVTDTGVSVISRPIENQLLAVVREGYAYKTTSFGVAYETDRSYLLFTPSTSNDTVATQCFRYNTFTSSWTKWDISKTCGIVNFSDDKLYLGAADLNYIEKERKTLSRTDYADREHILQVQLNGVLDKSIRLDSIANVSVGDVVIQKQYLTLSQFNRLLNKLDNDSGVADSNYLSTLQFKPGQDIRSKLSELALKLDNDTSVSGINYGSMIADYSHSVTNISVGTTTTLTIGAHSIQPGRFVTISGSNSSPVIDGTHKVLSATATTITVGVEVTVAGTAGTVQTALNDFRDIQACFNIVVTTLNSDPAVFYSDYSLSQGTVDFETVVLSLDKIYNAIGSKTNQAFMFGKITVYKAIRTKITWNPQFFQDPTIQKQVSEGTMMFENSNFSLVTVSYSTDLSPFYESTNFEGQGSGDFGQFNWSQQNWGGVAAAVPLRTLIPRGKQRCRFMNVQFGHQVAFEKFALYGMSLSYRMYSTRSYK